MFHPVAVGTWPLQQQRSVPSVRGSFSAHIALHRYTNPYMEGFKFDKQADRGNYQPLCISENVRAEGAPMMLEISKRLDVITVLLCHSSDAYLVVVVHLHHGKVA